MPLCLGSSSIYEHVHVSASLDDLFSRPLAVVGNTGSGKSWTVATAIQRTQRLLAKRGDYSPRFVILDLNGEYDRAFGIKAGHREPNSVYVNGQPFTLPLWTLNFEEFCRFFGASAATQAPVLERIVTFAREDAYDAGQPRAAGEDPRHVRQELRKIERAQQFLRTLVGQARTTDGPYVGTKARAAFAGLRSLLRFADGTEKLWIALDRASMQSVRGTIADIDGTDLVHYTDSKQPKQGEVKDPYDALPAEETDLIERLFEELDPLLTTLYDSLTVAGGLPTMTADTPYPFAPSRLNEGDLFDLALSGMRGEERIREYIATLRLRVRRLLQDRRWSVFWQGSWDLTLTELMEPILNSEIAVVDCSMLAQEVLPFVCAVIGRLLLDIRQHGSAAERTRTPWVLVLEEAHNCIRPRREGEHEGLALSRSTFERIAKEGRKFGLSLAIASQRPSDISDTALSQCANFIVHRIQNPNDIDYFRRTLPGGSRETLDQVSVLTPGEALLMGSAVNVPCRVRMWAPSPTPLSDTPKPTVGWLTSNPAFDAAAAIGRWAAVGNPPDSQTES